MSVRLPTAQGLARLSNSPHSACYVVCSRSSAGDSWHALCGFVAVAEAVRCALWAVTVFVKGVKDVIQTAASAVIEIAHVHKSARRSRAETTQ